MARPNNTPLKDWPPGWLKMECASILGEALFIMLHDHAKRAKGYPVTNDEMREFISASRARPALEGEKT